VTRSTILTILIVVLAFTNLSLADAKKSDRPNILWITCEDISPNLGCYGDSYAVTPHLDSLAERSVRYTNAFAPIGVCAPARSTIITGMYACSIGTHHMRCKGVLPAGVKCFPEYLQALGYYCTNNVKTDYNFNHPKSAWNESSRKAHWRNRKTGQPFFSVFNFTITHESRIRLPEKKLRTQTKHFPPKQRYDPAKAPLPPYHPDTPEVRHDWARYYDNITVMDLHVADLLEQLQQDGLADETIVFFYSDHGAGMPRSKRWLYDSSLRVPLMIHFPEKYRHLAPSEPDSTTDRLVSFVDFAPTVLSLAGAEIPAHMQGKAFLGQQATAPRQYIFGFRDRMDERTDMLRCVRDHRYKYIRNYMPYLPYFQHQYLDYQAQMPTMRIWQQLADEGKLTDPQAQFMTMTKPSEELYDTQADPWEINNLAADPEHRVELDRLRHALRIWMHEIRDLGLLSEADLRTRFDGQSPYDAVRKDPSSYPFERIQNAAILAAEMKLVYAETLTALLKDPDSAVRYWAALGLGALSVKAQSATEALLTALKDPSPSVRLVAAEAVAGLGQEEEALPVLIVGLKHNNKWVRLQAAQILDRLDDKARPALAAMQHGCSDDKKEYVTRVLKHAIPQIEH